MLDVAPARAGKLPPGMRATQVRPGQVRLVTRWDGDCRCVRSEDGKRLRVVRVPSRPSKRRGKLLKFDLEEAEIGAVIRRLAGELRLNPYLGPAIRGRVTGRVVSTSPQDALKMLLWMVDETFVFKILSDKSTLIVLRHQTIWWWISS